MVGLGVGEPRTLRLNVDAGADQLGVQRSGEGDQVGLGGTVSHVAGPGQERTDRRNVDDPVVALVNHLGAERPGRGAR